MTSHAELFLTANEQLTAVLDTVEDWTTASACEGWKVGDVVDHLIDTQRDFLQRHGLEIGPRPDTHDDPLDAWTAHASKIQDLLDTPAVAGSEFDGFFGRTTIGATLATFYGFDMVVHRWDIARGIGLEHHFNDAELDLIEQSLDGFGDHLYEEGICKPALPTTPDADRETRLLARMGRMEAAATVAPNG